jgi:hypothetical protein
MHLRTSVDVPKMIAGAIVVIVVAVAWAVSGIVDAFERYPVPATIATMAVVSGAAILTVRRRKAAAAAKARRETDAQRASEEQRAQRETDAQRFSEEQRSAEISRLKNKMTYLLNVIESCSTVKQTRSAVASAIFFIDFEGKFPVFTKAVPDAGEIRKSLEARSRVAQVADFLRRAKEHRFTGKRAKERDLLVRALFDAKESGVTDADFVTCNVRLDDANVATLETLERRARELGWDGGAA